jgi:hypothetical protein
MRYPLRNFWRIGLLAVAALATSACVVDPGYGYYGPGYYGAPATVYVGPAYYGGGYYHGGYGYHRWR